MNQEILDYFRKQLEVSYLRRIEKKPNEVQHQTLPEHLEMNNGFAKLVFNERPFKLVGTNFMPKNLQPEIAVPNEKNPDPADLENPRVIDVNKVIEYLRMNDSVFINQIPPISTVQEPYIKLSSFSSYPPPFYRKDAGVIGLSLKEISEGNQPCSGYFQLWRFVGDSYLPITEPLYFENNKFTQTFNQEIYFSCPGVDLNIHLGCFIYKQNQAGLIPYAFGTIPIFENVDGKPRQKLGTTFGNNFIQLVGSDIKLIINNYFKNTGQKVPINITSLFAFRFMGPTEYDFTYSWLDKLDGRLLGVPIAPKHFYPTPVISLYDFSLILKNPPKNSFLYFRAYIFNDQYKPGTQPSSIPFFTSKTNEKKSEYFSSSLPPSTVVTFNDNIRILINKQLNNQSHLGIFIFSFNQERKEAQLFKVGFIPLFNTSNTNDEPMPQKFNLYEPKKIPKDYLKHVKAPNKTYISCRITLPPVFCLSPSCQKLSEAKENDAVELPDGDNESLFTVMTPVFAKILSILSLEKMNQLIIFMGKFDKNKLKEIRSWIYNAFDPVAINPNIINLLLSFLSTLMNDSVKAYLQSTTKKEKPRTSLLQKTDSIEISNCEVFIHHIMQQIPIYMELIIISMTEMRGKFEQNKMILFFKIFAEFLYEGYTKVFPEDALSAIESVSYLLFISMNYMNFKDISECAFLILRSIIMLRSQEKAKANEISRLQYHFLLQFAVSKTFLVGLGTIVKNLNIKNSYSPYNKLLSLIFLSVYDGLTSDDNDSLSCCVSFISMLGYHLETMPDETASHISFMLFPLVNIIFNDFESPLFKNNPNIQTNLIPFVLVVLNKSHPTQLQIFFSGLPTSFQQSFITFLNSMLTVISSNVETKLNYFLQATLRFLKFLLCILPYCGQSIKQVFLLIQDLLNQYQTPRYYPIFYGFLSQAIKQFPCERILISILLNRIISPLMSTRCLSTALLSLQFRYDYSTNGSIVLSSIDMMDSLTSILLEKAVNEIDIYGQLIDLIVNISSQWNDPQFFAQIKERMEAAKVIATVVKTQKTSTFPIEERCQQIMKIANQYNIYPTMRLKWLQECLKINNENGDKISAFVTQLHVVALIATVYQYNRQILDTSPVEEGRYHISIVQPIKYASKLKDSVLQTFSFMPEVARETQIDFNSMHPVALGLLTELSNSLTSEIELAIQFGCEAGLYYSLRPLHSFQLRLYQRTRNFSESAKACKQLAEHINSISFQSSTLTHDIPITPYLVIDKNRVAQQKAGNLQSPQIPVYNQVFYCSKEEKFMDIFITKERGNMRFTMCPKHAMGCANNGVCVVPLEIDDDESIDDEHRHCWKRFRSQIFISDYENTDFSQKQVNVMYVETKKPIPHYKMSVSVKNIEVVPYSVLELVRMGAEKTLKVCDVATQDIEMWFENEHNVDHDLTADKLFADEISKLMKIMDCILKGKDCLFDRLKRLRVQKPMEAKEIATQIKEALNRIIKVLARCAADLPMVQTINVHFNMYMVLVNDFCKEFDLGNIKPVQIESHKDPMTQIYEFENQEAI